jgi:DNA-binding MarR family transcriptional regulator
MAEDQSSESIEEGAAAAGSALPEEAQALVCDEILTLANRLILESAEVLRPAGLTHAQYNALRVLREAGEGGLPCSDISRRMITRDPDVTRLHDRLEKGTWIVRERSAADRRTIHARITEEGLQRMAGLDGPVREFLARRFGPLGEHGLLWLHKLLKAVQG